MSVRRGVMVAGALLIMTGLGWAQQVREVFRRVNPSVVVIHTQQKSKGQAGVEGELGARSLGSGLLVSADGKILTAAHVIQTADRVEVEFLGGRRVAAKILSSAPFADVALLQLTEPPPPNAAVATMGDSDQVEIGDHIFVIGAPYGATHSLSVGYISARRTADRIFEGLAALEVFQTDAAIYEGNSGGPIFNLNGEVIGIVSHVLTRAEGANGPGFAVTSNVARRLLLEQKRIWMGIEAWLVTGTLAEAFNVPQAAGMLVQSVADGSLGDRLGLREGTVSATLEENAMVIGGDIILEILGTQIRPDGSVIPEIQQILNGMRSGDSVTMKVLRRGRILELTTPISAE